MVSAMQPTFPWDSISISVILTAGCCLDLDGNCTPLKISPQNADVSTKVWTEEDIATKTRRMEEMRANRQNRKASCLLTLLAYFERSSSMLIGTRL